MKLRHIAIGTFSLVLATIYASPWCIYRYALGKVDSMPVAPAYRASPAEIQAVWARAHGAGEPAIHPGTPYDYIGLIFFDTEKDRQAEWNIVGRIATRYDDTHMRDKHHWWHVAGAAMAIWLTRNWTAEQIFSQAVENEKQRRQAIVSLSCSRC
ncbi:MAG: hypothetical protein JO142_10955 [Burkholderiales bacterium]|nr:hypothetical protein [Burkholderiales bacterium]